MKSGVLKWSWVLGFFGLSACSTQVDPAGEISERNSRQALGERLVAKPKLAVLFIGNSYSFGVPKAFAKVAAERNKDVRTGHSTFGGWTLAKHAAYDGTLKKIREGSWDIVVIQEHSEIPAMPRHKRDASMFPPLRTLVSEVRQQNAIPILYQTWGRRDGDAKRKNDDFHAMTQRLSEGYQAAARDAGGIVIAPVGDAWEREFSAGRGAELFMEDGSHPSARGNAVTALEIYQTIYDR